MPLLLAALCALLLLSPAPEMFQRFETPYPAQQDPGGRQPGEKAASRLETEIFDLVNRERRQRGLKELKWDPTLAEVAREHSRAMLEEGFFSHSGPAGTTPAERVSRVHEREVLLVAENLWSGTNVPRREVAAQAVEGWLDSQGHRKNMFLAGARFMGVGTFSNELECRVTVLFADLSE